MGRMETTSRSDDHCSNPVGRGGDMGPGQGGLGGRSRGTEQREMRRRGGLLPAGLPGATYEAEEVVGVGGDLVLFV